MPESNCSEVTKNQWHELDMVLNQGTTAVVPWLKTISSSKTFGKEAKPWKVQGQMTTVRKIFTCHSSYKLYVP